MQSQGPLPGVSLHPCLSPRILQEACAMLSSLLMTFNCFILHTPDLKFAESACLLFSLPSNFSHRMLEAAGKAA